MRLVQAKIRRFTPMLTQWQGHMPMHLSLLLSVTMLALWEILNEMMLKTVTQIIANPTQSFRTICNFYRRRRSWVLALYAGLDRSTSINAESAEHAGV